MSRELISSEKFPPKPHNSPASKVPGLIFCAGQTATGEIKQATVSYSFRPRPRNQDGDSRVNMYKGANTVKLTPCRGPLCKT